MHVDIVTWGRFEALLALHRVLSRYWWPYKLFICEITCNIKRDLIFHTPSPYGCSNQRRTWSPSGTSHNTPEIGGRVRCSYVRLPVKQKETSYSIHHLHIFTMVTYFLRWTLLKFFSSFPDEQSQQKVRQLDRITAQWLIHQMKLRARYCGNFEFIIFLWEF